MEYYQISKGQLNKLTTELSKLKTNAVKGHKNSTDKKSKFWFLGYERCAEEAIDSLMGLRLKRIPEETELVRRIGEVKA